MTRYRRDNTEFRQSLARKPKVYRLSIWQTLIVGLVVNILKAWMIIGTWFAKN